MRRSKILSFASKEDSGSQLLKSGSLGHHNNSIKKIARVNQRDSVSSLFISENLSSESAPNYLHQSLNAVPTIRQASKKKLSRDKGMLSGEGSLRNSAANVSSRESSEDMGNLKLLELKQKESVKFKEDVLFTYSKDGMHRGATTLDRFPKQPSFTHKKSILKKKNTVRNDSVGSIPAQEPRFKKRVSTATSFVVPDVEKDVIPTLEKLLDRKLRPDDIAYVMRKEPSI